MRRIHAWGIIAALFAFSSCANIPKKAGFTDVKNDVEARTEFVVEWHQDEEAYADFQVKKQEMLSDSLTLAEAVQIALLNNRSLQAEYESLGIMYADLVQAGLFRNPILSAHIGYPVEEDHKPDLGFSLSFNFLDLFYTPLKKTIAASALEEVRLSLTGAVLLKTNEVTQAFYRAQAAEQVFEMLGQVALAAEASAAASGLLHDAGNIQSVDLYNEEAFYEQTRLDLAMAELEVFESREVLNQLMGLWGEQTTWQITSRLANPDEAPSNADEIEKMAIEASLDLAQAAARLETYGHRAGLVNASSILPNLELGVGAQREGSWEIGPECGFPLPLFDQGQAQKAIAAAEIRRQQAAYYALGVEVRSTSRILAQQLATSYQAALHYRNVILPLRSRISTENQALFNAMQIGVFQLLTARQQEIMAGRNYIEALKQFWMAKANFTLLLQGKLPGKLEQMNTRSMTAMPAQASGGH